MEKSLPPLPGLTRTKKPPPLLLERPLIPTSRIRNADEQLIKENEHLCRLLAKMQVEQEESTRYIAELQAQNHRYREQSKSQKQLVVQIANSISNAFREYGESLQSPTPPSTKTREGSSEYEDVISAWSDSTSSF